MSTLNPRDTPQAQILIHAGVSSPQVAELLGLSFADRDLELIEHLKALEQIPEPADFPPAAAVADALSIQPRWASFVLEKVQRFVHKRRMNGDYSADIAHFANRPDVLALASKARTLNRGRTVFIGDSLMDNRHFSANASFAVLVGGFLEAIGVGPYTNAGVGGNTTAQGLARFERDDHALAPVRIVLSFGCNDLSNNVPLDSILQNFQQMIDGARRIHSEIILGLALNVIPEKLWWADTPPKNFSPESRAALQSAMEQLALKNAVPCLNVLPLLHAEHYCVDGIHLNQSGQDICGAELLAQLCEKRI